MTKIEKVTAVETKDVYKVETSNHIYNAYKARTTHPDYIESDVLVYNKDNADNTLSSIDLSDYDMVIFESSLKSIPLKNDAALGQDDYSALYGAFNGGLPMVYDDSISSGSSGGGSTYKIEAPNFAYLYGKLTTATMNSDLSYTASTNDKVKYNNVLLTNTKKMVAYTSAPFPAAEKDIVDIINNGTFRGLGNGNGDASNKYNVLEIQPCYPIDTYMASKLGKFINGNYGFKTGDLKDGYFDPGFYYMITDGVLNNVTPDEITYDGENSLSYTYEVAGDFDSILTNDTDGSVVSKINYYAWEMSPAKVLHILKHTNPALGFSTYTLNQINVDHMSLNEFISNRSALLENYDMIYIGGNTSAIKSNNYFKMYFPENGDINGKASELGEELRTFVGGTYYRMFYHNGEWMKYSNDNATAEFNKILTLQTGNDLTATRLADLEEYFSSGMPIVVSSAAVKGFETAVAGGYSQHEVDPDSRMFKLLNELNAAKDVSENIVWNFNEKATIMIPNENAEYGETVSGFATVFEGADETDYFGEDKDVYSDNGAQCIANCINSSKYRPKFSLAKAPTPYNEYDSSTWIDKKQISFDIEVNSKVLTGTTKASLYIDLNGDGKFTVDDDERLQGPIDVGSNGKLTITQNLADDFYGGLYWKIEVSNGSCKAATIGICKIKKKDTDAKTIVNVLQLYPEAGEYETSLNTLYFCTECQRFRKRFESSLTYGKDGSTKYGENSLMSKDDAVNEDITETFFGLEKPDLKKIGDKYNKYTLGIHHHTFGIVKYGTNNDLPDWDDWDSNWADALYDEYDFNLNLMTTEEFDEKISEVLNIYKDLSDEEKVEEREKYSGNAEVFYNYYLCMKYLIENNITVSLSGDTLTLTKGYGQIGATQFNSFVTYMKDELDVSAAKLLEYAQAKGKLDAQINVSINNVKNGATLGNTSTSISKETIIKDLEYIKKYQVYSDYYNFFNSGAQSNNANDPARAYSKVYGPYRDAMLYEQYFYDNWLQNKEYSCYNDEGKVDFSKLYDTIVVGAAEYKKDKFDKDMTLQSCEALLTYDKGDGHLFLLHDTLSVDTPNMTATLRELFGQDARHEVVSKSSASDKLIIGNSFSITVDNNQTFSYVLPGNKKSATVVYKQDSSMYSSSRTIPLEVGDYSSSFVLSPKVEGTNITVQKQVKSTMNLQLIDPWNNVKRTIEIDPTATEVTLTYYHDNAWSFNSIDYDKVEVTYSGTNTSGNHNIRFTCKTVLDKTSNNGNWADGSNKEYRLRVGTTGNASTVASGGSVDLPNTTTQTVSYKMNSVPFGKTSEKINQQIKVTVLDENGNSVNGQQVKVNNVSQNTSSGVASFNVPNYNTGSYKYVTSSTVDLTDTSAVDNQVLSVKILDESGDPKQGVQISLKNNTAQTNGLYSKVNYSGQTDSSGVYSGANNISNYRAASTAEYLPNYTYTGQYAAPEMLSLASQRYYVSQLSETGTINFNFSATALTTRMGMPDSGKNKTLASFMTKYSLYSHEPESVPCQDGQFDHKDFNEKGKMCTDRASLVNRGLVTLYPFTIGETLNISGTHAQTFSVDLEDTDMTVWYSLAGGINGSASSFLAASPNDGQNNYFIYSYGNVTYCGVGHGSVTGHHAANNDERRLLINVIVNNSKKAAIGTSVNLYDADSTKDDLKNETIIPKSDGSYQMTVTGDTEYPNFSFLASTDAKSGSTIKRVHVYYDLDLNDGEDPHTYDFGTANGNHILIYDTGVMNASKSRDFNGVLRYVDNNKPDGPDSDYYVKNSIGEFNLKLNPNYMRDHNGQKYTYIIVCVTTTSKSGVDSTIYKKIKLVPIPVMYDLN